MVIVFRPGVSEADVQRVIEQVEGAGLKTHVSRGTTHTIVGCIGDEDRLRELALISLPGVESVLSIAKPYKLAAREYAAGPTTIPLGAGTFGSGFAVIAGPCSVENAEMLSAT